MKLKINSIHITRELYGENRGNLTGHIELRNDDLTVTQRVDMTPSMIERVLDIANPTIAAAIEDKFGVASDVSLEPEMRLTMKETEGEVVES